MKTRGVIGLVRYSYGNFITDILQEEESEKKPRTTKKLQAENVQEALPSGHVA